MGGGGALGTFREAKIALPRPDPSTESRCKNSRFTTSSIFAHFGIGERPRGGDGRDRKRRVLNQALGGAMVAAFGSRVTENQPKEEEGPARKEEKEYLEEGRNWYR